MCRVLPHTYMHIHIHSKAERGVRNTREEKLRDTQTHEEIQRPIEIPEMQINMPRERANSLYKKIIISRLQECLN